MALRAFGLNGTLKAGPESSSTQKLLDQVLHALGGHGVESSHARIADFNVKAGVKADEGDGDQMPDPERRSPTEGEDRDRRGHEGARCEAEPLEVSARAD